MEKKSQSNLSNKEQKELLQLSNDKTILIKPSDKRGAVVILSIAHQESMIMQHLLDENTYKKVGSCINNELYSNILRFLRQHKMCFTEPEQKFLDDKRDEISNFYGLPKIHKTQIMNLL